MMSSFVVEKDGGDSAISMKTAAELTDGGEEVALLRDTKKNNIMVMFETGGMQYPLGTAMKFGDIAQRTARAIAAGRTMPLPTTVRVYVKGSPSYSRLFYAILDDGIACTLTEALKFILPTLNFDGADIAHCPDTRTVDVSV
jgi:hypothetical protein